MGACVTKKLLSIAEQISLLKERGLVIEDEELCAHALRRFGYYRLSGYWYQFRIRYEDEGKAVTLDDFMPNVTFEDVLAIYEFDRRLRFLVFEMVELLEVAMRFKIGHILGETNPDAHADHNIFQNDFLIRKRKTKFSLKKEPSQHELLIRGINRELKRSSEDFVSHHFEKHEGKFPVWAVTEIMSFGQLLKLIKGSKDRYQNEIAKSLGLTSKTGDGQGGALLDWLENLNEIRNICAHHGRLWNRRINKRLKLNHLRLTADTRHIYEIQKELQNKNKHFDLSTSRIYGSLTILLYLNRQLDLDSSWASKLITHIETLPKPANLFQMGFPANWKDQPIWAD